MNKEKVIYGIYDDDDVILDAVKAIREKGHHIDEVYSPFPIHGLDHAMGLKHSRIAITSFIYGCIGASCALLMFWYMMVYDWQMIIGGKPNFTLNENLPAFIPITFEMTVFFAAHLMVVTFLIRCGLYPGSSSTSPDPRTTDDKFLMEIHVDGDTKKVKKIKDLMKKTGAIEIKEKE
tara:strand:- start:299 stop:829 length:531 start_codon:yes stop_codon:yes gene_type:complete